MRLLQMTGALVALSLLAGETTGPKGPPCVWLANDLIGMSVISQQGDDLGKIEDVVVHPGGQSSYAVLSFGGWLGMRDKLFAMPWTVLRTVEQNTEKKDSKRSLVLPLDKERLKTAPGFDQNNWPDVANPEWAKDVDAFYVGDVNPNTKRPVDNAVRSAAITWRATDLKGTNIENQAGENLGDLKEIAIDTNGRVSYVAVSVGGFLGVGDHLIAVPWDSLSFSLGGDNGHEKMISLAKTEEQLEKAPQFKEGTANGPEMCNPEWISGVYDYFSCPAYWDTTGQLEPKQGPKN